MELASESANARHSQSPTLQMRNQADWQSLSRKKAILDVLPGRSHESIVVNETVARDKTGYYNGATSTTIRAIVPQLTLATSDAILGCVVSTGLLWKQLTRGWRALVKNSPCGFPPRVGTRFRGTRRTPAGEALATAG